ncbi:MAG: phosphotransferase [Roseovarius sp.]|nr:phosphotransferase [Roseovarius sp.]
MTADSPDDFQPRLARALANRGLVPTKATWQTLAGGRTNLSWRIEHSGVVQVVKLYAPAGQNPLFPNDPAQEAAILHHLSGHNLAPEVVYAGEIAQRAVLIYPHLKGNLWLSDTAQVARLLHRVHSQERPSGLRQTPNGSAALVRQTLRILENCLSPQALELAQMQPMGEVAPCARRALLHGDPVPGNIIVTPDGARLIDWQCPAKGDPCEDIALFLSPAMQMAYRGSALAADEIAQFLRAYPEAQTVQRYRDLAPWYHWRMAAYCLWKHEQGHHQDHSFSQLESVYLVAGKQFLA